MAARVIEVHQHFIARLNLHHTYRAAIGAHQAYSFGILQKNTAFSSHFFSLAGSRAVAFLRTLQFTLFVILSGASSSHVHTAREDAADSWPLASRTFVHVLPFPCGGRKRVAVVTRHS